MQFGFSFAMDLLACCYSQTLQVQVRVRRCIRFNSDLSQGIERSRHSSSFCTTYGILRHASAVASREDLWQQAKYSAFRHVSYVLEVVSCDNFPRSPQTDARCRVSRCN